MSKAVVDIAEVQRALDRAARNAKRGPSELRAGRVLVGRGKGNGHVRRRGKEPARAAREA
jgi:hypothetical protein